MEGVLSSSSSTFTWNQKVEYVTEPPPPTNLSTTAPFPATFFPTTFSSAAFAVDAAQTRAPLPMESFDIIVAALEKTRGHRLSAEQVAICRHIYEQNDKSLSDAPHGHAQADSRHMMIDSVAGSGKTSTLLMCLWFLPPNAKVLLLSFNKTVQQTLELEVRRNLVQTIKSLGRELPDCSIYTCHAHGLAALKRHFPGASTNGAWGAGDDVADNKYQAIRQAIDELNCKHLHKTWSWHMQSMLKLLMNLAVDCPSVNDSHARGGPQMCEEFVISTGKKYGVPIPSGPSRAHQGPSAPSKAPSVSKNRRSGKKSQNGEQARLGRAEQGNVVLRKVYDDYMRVLYRAYQICCQRQARFDFSDMVYLPVRLNLPLIQYDVVLIDEAQDLNAIQIEMIARTIKAADSLNRGGRIIFVGDKNQAIYGFRGADTEAISTIQRRFNTMQFPLHTCWRCPKNVIRLAQASVPYINARPGAPDGKAVIHNCYSRYDRNLDTDVICDRLFALSSRDQTKGHLVLCRTNAPLIKLALELFQRGIDCFLAADTLRGALEKLLHIIDEQEWIQGRRLKDRVEHYRSWKQKNILEEGEDNFEKNDQLDSLHAIVKAMGDPTVAEVSRLITRLFTAPSCSGGAGGAGGANSSACSRIKLATIHQCKGQEEDFVYLIKPSLLPHPYTVQTAQTMETRWQLDQEENLRYVAVTRAKQEFHYFKDTQE